MSVAGVQSEFPAADVSVSGSAQRGCPLHPGARTHAGSIPAGASHYSAHKSDIFLQHLSPLSVVTVFRT